MKLVYKKIKIKSTSSLLQKQGQKEFLQKIYFLTIPYPHNEITELLVSDLDPTKRLAQYFHVLIKPPE